MIINLKEAKSFNLHKKLSEFIIDKSMIYLFENEEEHYNLLAYISNKIDNGIILDIGTHRGFSSLAFSINESNKIHTYDIRQMRGGIERNINPIPENVKWNIKQILEDDDDLTLLLKSDLIFIDIDHKGKIETEIYEYLVSKNYKGIVLLDDIYFNSAMIDFWNGIDIKKYDLTAVGHSGSGTVGHSHIKSCGTGLIDFDSNIKIVENLND
jgi:predicted O-methyltransferase YrrM